MTFVLAIAGRQVARGSLSAIVDTGVELGVIELQTVGAHTADSVHVPRIVDRAASIRAEATAGEHVRRAA